MATSKTVKRTSKWDSEAAKTAKEPTPINEEVAKDTAAEDWVPELTDYNATDENGEAKKDDFKRIVIMVDKTGTKMYPVMWFGISVLEASAVLAEAMRVIANDITVRVLQREQQVEQDKQNAVLDALRKIGILGGNEPQSIPGVTAEIG